MLKSATIVSALALFASSAALAAPFRSDVKAIEQESGLGLEKVLHISYRTNEGMHRIVLRPADSISREQQALELYQGHLRGSKRQIVGADLSDKGLALRYIGRRGRAYLVRIPPGQLQARISMVPKSYPIACATEGAATTLGAISPAVRDLRVQKTFKVLEVGAFADYEFVAGLGFLPGVYLDATFNTIRAQYESQLGLTLKVTYQRLFSTFADQPLRASNSDRLLTQFQDYVGDPATSFAVASDTNHLFTGKNLENAVVGLAYLGTVCRSNGQFAFGLSQLVPEAAQWIVTAHEIGHNLNASHTSLGSGIMSPSVDASLNYFSQKSVREITTYVNRYGSCMRPNGPTVRLATRLSSGTRFKAAFRVANLPDDNPCIVSIYGSSSSKRLQSNPAKGRLLAQIPVSNNGATSRTANISKGRSESKRYYFAATVQCVGTEAVQLGTSSVSSISSQNSRILASLASKW